MFSHLDYIGRYESYPDYDVLEHVTTLDKVLKTLISIGKNLEINTSDYLSPNPIYLSQDNLKFNHQHGSLKPIIRIDTYRVDASTQFYWRTKQNHTQIFSC